MYKAFSIHGVHFANTYVNIYKACKNAIRAFIRNCSRNLYRCTISRNFIAIMVRDITTDMEQIHHSIM